MRFVGAVCTLVRSKKNRGDADLTPLEKTIYEPGMDTLDNMKTLFDLMCGATNCAKASHEFEELINDLKGLLTPHSLVGKL